MARTDVSPQERELIENKLKIYFQTELDRDLDSFEAGFLVDFLTDNLGAFFYNRGLYDAQTILASRVDSLTEAILDLEKPIT